MPSPSILDVAPDRPLAESRADAVARPRPVVTTLHLIGSAHLDPVWLWDWREGMGEAIATCRAMVAMLREFPDFRFIRGEAAVYAHIERHAPELFADIRTLIGEGRWDVVGGNWIQPDTNLPGTEALLRQFSRGKGYFRDKFGAEVTAAWAADSFGHSAGLPDILAAAGMDSFAFTRPQQKILPLRRQAFWWRGRSGARVLAYRPYDGWYASERANLGDRLDACLARAAEEGLETAAMFYGLGNHGGGPSRAHLREIREWARSHPEVRVEHSGLHRLFAALRAELGRRGEDLIETREGELNFCLRGCSASVARFKYAYRRAESRLLRSERTVAAVSGACRTPVASFRDTWDTMLFNAFHDILPGSSIERAYEDQLAQVGGVQADAQRMENDALAMLAANIDTTAGAWPVPEDHPLPQPVLVWNPHPWTLRTRVEVEVSLDYRPLWKYHGRHDEAPVVLTDTGGRRLPFQIIAEENDSMRDLLWRRRAVVPVVVPPMGWTVLHMGLDPGKACAMAPLVPSAMATGPASIENGRLALRAEIGSRAVALSRAGRAWLAGGLQARLYEDPWGAWGGMNEERASWDLADERERLKITLVKLLEEGPERASLWVRFEGVRSRVDITFLLGRESEHVEMRVRAFLDERGARLKLVMPVGGEAEYSVPGGTVLRGPCGEVPGGRWVRVGKDDAKLGFASDSLYGFDTTADEFRATIARTSRFGSDVARAPGEQPWQPCADLGEHVFRAVLTPDQESIPRLADELEEPPVVLPVASHCPVSARELPAGRSLMALQQPGLRLLSLTPAPLEFRLQNLSVAPVALAEAGISWLGCPLTFPSSAWLAVGEIRSWRLSRTPLGWEPLPSSSA